MNSVLRENGRQRLTNRIGGESGKLAGLQFMQPTTVDPPLSREVVRLDRLELREEDRPQLGRTIQGDRERASGIEHQVDVRGRRARLVPEEPERVAGAPPAPMYVQRNGAGSLRSWAYQGVRRLAR